MQRDIRTSIRIQPDSEENVFRIGVADDVLRLLVDAHDTEFTVPELVDMTGAARSTVWRAINLLDRLDIIRVRETPQRNYVSIDPAYLQKPDPVFAVRQEEFYSPIRAFLEEIQTAIDGSDGIDQLIGVVLFGSTARGEADRQSDIDLFVVVEGDRTAARRRVTDVVSDLRERRFDGDRFDFEPYVESVESVQRASEKLQEIFREGICLYGTNELQALRKEVFAHE